MQLNIVVLASRRRFTHAFKIFLPINSVYIRKFDVLQEIINSNKNSQKLSFSNQGQDARCQMPPVFEVNAFKLILKYVFAHNFPGDYCRIPELYFWYINYVYGRICNKKNITILYHMLALFSCKNNSEMIKSVKNELP